MTQPRIDAVIFDLDGVLIDSEQVWDDVRETYAKARGGTWTPQAHRDMMGMSSPEWSRYMHERIGLRESPERINADVVAELIARYGRALPLIPGAREAVERIAAAFTLGLASSSNREIIDAVLAIAGLRGAFAVTVSSEEVGRGKPAPDVYLRAAALLDVAPTRAAAIEDSANGLRSARAAVARVIAIPNAHYPPAPDALAGADVVLHSIAELHVATVDPARAIGLAHEQGSSA